jgi:ABC-2 type transport system ATP-binding protein
MIRTESLTKTFGDLKAVDSLSLDIAPGQFFACLGPNGAGKTTTIRMLVGLIRPTSGRAFVNGHEIQQASLESRKALAYIPDFPFLYDKLTAQEVMWMTGELFEMDRSLVQKETDRWFEYLHLGEYRHELTENLSHGTRQRVVFASAFLHSPRTMIVDEPMVGLDPRHARLVKDALKEFTRQGGTVFLSTHILSVAEELADTIGILHRGKLIALGSAAELKERSGQSGPLEAAFLAMTESESDSTAATRGSLS